MDKVFEEELKQAILKVKNKFGVVEPLNIVIATEQMAVSVISSNKPYNPNYRQGYINGFGEGLNKVQG